MKAPSRPYGLAAAALLTVVLWRLPFGTYLLYPFTILATWFHEMGHGLAALLLGGSFHRLLLYPDGSGMAVSGGDLAFGRLGPALTAAAGPLGPALAGALLILASRREKTTRFALTALAVVMATAVVLWTRTFFGIVVITLLAALILFIAVKAPPRLREPALQFLGVQACISVYLQIGYLFTRRVVLAGTVTLSDTGQIAQQLGLPHWFWAALLTALTIALPVWSLRVAWRRREPAAGE